MRALLQTKMEGPGRHYGRRRLQKERQGSRGKARRGNPASSVVRTGRTDKKKGTSKLRKSPVGGPGTASWVQARENEMVAIMDAKQKEASSARGADLQRRQKVASDMRTQQAALVRAAPAAANLTESTESMVMRSYWRQKEEERAAKAQAKAEKAQFFRQKRVEAEAEAAKRARALSSVGTQKVLGPGKSITRAGKTGKVAQRQKVIVGVSITGKPAVAGKTYRPPRRNLPASQRVKSKGAWKNISKAGSAASFYGFAAVILFAAYTLAKSGSQLVDTSAYKGTAPSGAPAPAPAPVVEAEVAAPAPAEAAAADVDAPALSADA